MPTPARNALNNHIIPDFSRKFHLGGEVLFVGKDRKWDYSGWFPKCNYQTLDIDPKIKPDILADIESCGLKDNSFDGVIMTGVYEHLKNPLAAIREIRSILKPKGKALICVPGRSYYKDIDKSCTLIQAIEYVSLLRILSINITYYKDSIPYYIHIYAEKA